MDGQRALLFVAHDQGDILGIDQGTGAWQQFSQELIEIERRRCQRQLIERTELLDNATVAGAALLLRCPLGTSGQVLGELQRNGGQQPLVRAGRERAMRGARWGRNQPTSGFARDQHQHPTREPCHTVRVACAGCC